MELVTHTQVPASLGLLSPRSTFLGDNEPFSWCENLTESLWRRAGSIEQAAEIQSGPK